MASDFQREIQELKQALLQPAADYAAAKEQARVLDDRFGFRCAAIEEKLFQTKSKHPADKQLWIGLDLQSLQTPYSEITEMIRHLSPVAGEVWMDLGAGYGRMGIVLGLLHPLTSFIGYEMLPERVEEGNRVFRKWKLDRCHLETVDLGNADFHLREADLYFLYDFGSREDVYRILGELARIARQRPIRVIARGRGVRNWITMDFPWLSQIQAPEKFENWTIFRS